MSWRVILNGSRYTKVFGLVIFLSLAVFFLISCGRVEKADKAVNTDSSNNGQREVLYYTCGMHPTVRVSVEEYEKGNVKCPICTMDLVPVYKKGAVPEKKNRQGKILYYRNPMNPKITSSVPAKDSMGMDYIPVYENDVSAENEEGTVATVYVEREQAIRADAATVPARFLKAFKKIRTVGKVAYDPGLVVAQEEFLSALKAMEKISQTPIPEVKERAEGLVEASRRKLRLLGLSNEQIDRLRTDSDIQRNLILPEDKMWVYGDAYEYELGWLREGQKARITTIALPGEVFEGEIVAINPVLDAKTRSVRFRVIVENPAHKLQPEMYVDIEIMAVYHSPDGREKVLAIPKEAVIDTGTRKIVWVDAGGGNFEGREVKLGPEGVAIVNGEELKVYPVLKGLKRGEQVVTKANFLIDSQSQLTGVAAAAAYSGALDKTTQEK